MPSSDDRSDVPISSTSMPSTAAMSAAFFTASGTFDHHHRQDFVVDRLLRLRHGRRPEAVDRRRPAPASPSLRRIAKRLGDAPRLLRGIDMRHDDAERAIVQRARRFVDRVGADPHQRRDTGGQRRNAELCDLAAPRTSRARCRGTASRGRWQRQAPVRRRCAGDARRSPAPPRPPASCVLVLFGTSGIAQPPPRLWRERSTRPEAGQSGDGGHCEERSGPRVKPGASAAISITVHNAMEIASLRSQ